MFIMTSQSCIMVTQANPGPESNQYVPIKCGLFEKGYQIYANKPEYQISTETNWIYFFLFISPKVCDVSEIAHDVIKHIRDKF